MSNTVVYYPYQSDKYFSVATLIVSSLSFVAFGYCLADWIPACCFFGVIGIVALWLSKSLYDSAQICLLFEPKGIRLIGGKCQNGLFVRWDKCPYAYYTQNYKGHLFVILSQYELSSKQIRMLANQSANAYKICVESKYTIHLNHSQTASQIKELINQTVQHVNFY